jgi:hypothetical protein
MSDRLWLILCLIILGGMLLYGVFVLWFEIKYPRASRVIPPPHLMECGRGECVCGLDKWREAQ